jgi:hypothetical protein
MITSGTPINGDNRSAIVNIRKTGQNQPFARKILTKNSIR